MTLFNNQDEQEIEVMPLSAQGPTADELAPMFDECADEPMARIATEQADHAAACHAYAQMQAQAVHLPLADDAVVDIATALLDGPFTPDALAAWVAAYDIRAAEYATQHAQETLRLEEIAAINSWNKLLQEPSYVERDKTDEWVHIEDDLRTGAIPLDQSIQTDDMGLSSVQIGPTLSVQCDAESGTLLLASDTAQILIASAAEEGKLEQLLYERRCARYEALHRSFYGKYK